MNKFNFLLVFYCKVSSEIIFSKGSILICVFLFLIPTVNTLAQDSITAAKNGIMLTVWSSNISSFRCSYERRINKEFSSEILITFYSRREFIARSERRYWARYLERKKSFHSCSQVLVVFAK